MRRDLSLQSLVCVGPELAGADGCLTSWKEMFLYLDVQDSSAEHSYKVHAYPGSKEAETKAIPLSQLA